MLLTDLTLVADYFDGPEAALYEADLIARYGQDEVHRAIDDGVLAHGWIPCGKGRRRCVVRLAQKDAQKAPEGLYETTPT